MSLVWTETVQLPKFSELLGDCKTDVLIIGGGITGILCAYFMEKEGISYILVEADTICSGITKNTTAKITSQHGLIYDKLLRRFGRELTQRYLKLNESAIKEYGKICRNIDCDFEYKDSYVYTSRSLEKIEKEIRALEILGYNAEFENQLDIPVDIMGAVRFHNQAQFHPLKFIAAIAEGLNIYEHTKVTELEKNVAKTNHGNINADKIVVATHFPINNKHGAYFLKMYQSRSYVIALENAGNVNGMYIDEDAKGMSFRNYDNLLFLGGGGHRTGKSGGSWQVLREFADKYYPGAKERYAWAAQDCMTLDGIPYVGTYGKNTHGFYLMSGYNKWGMTSSMVAAQLINDLITKSENIGEALFNPHRTMLRPQLFINGYEAVTNIVRFADKRCPHMGCSLKWNKDEHSWDCPCHGSRFSENGELIDNPATDDLKEKR
ncbi:MAG: FAD-dependent oxidoreductase [Eubacteriales bacterium]|nr:FAD-dependent oxidoreductase [Eubacteriales bacterium]